MKSRIWFIRTAVILTPALCLAQGSSGSGVDTVSGNDLHPTGLSFSLERDERGLATFKKKRSRTPTGLLYANPFPPAQYGELGEGWQYHLDLEAGYLDNDGLEGAEELIEYGDWDDGLVANTLDFYSFKPDTGAFVGVRGGGLTRDDQYLHVEGGRYGSFQLNAMFKETPHVFTTGAQTIYDGVGTSSLTLPPELTPGNNSIEDIEAALQALVTETLALSREKSHLGFQVTPNKRTKIFGGYNREEREGTRPFGGGFFPPFYGTGIGGLVETVEPIDYTTHELSMGLHYAAERYQYNIELKGSFFRNDEDRLVWENPFLNFPGGALIVERGQLALYPDNDFYNVKSDFAAALPMNGRFTATLSWSRMSQDEDLLPPTVNSGIAGPIDLSFWNTTDALSRKTADAEIDTLLFQAMVKLVPWQAVTLKAKLRYYDEDNKTDYEAFNPLTGQYGYIIEDGAHGGGVFQPGVPGSQFRFRSIPFAVEKTELSLDGHFRLARKRGLSLELLSKRTDRDFREREETDENRIALRFSDRSIPRATVRLSYEYSDRDGSEYRFNPYEAFFTSSLPGYVPVLPDGGTPHTLGDLRKFDLSDRERNALDARVNFLIGQDMDLFVSGNWGENEYGAEYGRKDDASRTVNLEWSYAPSPKWSTFVFFSNQKNEHTMASINDAGFDVDPDAGGGSFPLTAAWSEAEEEDSDIAGLGFNAKLGHFFLDCSYHSVSSDSSIAYDFASEQAFGFFGDPVVTAEDAGNAFPDISFSRRILETKLGWRLNRLFITLYHRWEKSDTDDWHYDQLTNLVARGLFLGIVPQDYDVNVYGLFARYRFL